jgi:GNAT superfamily N-acetyltransferase
MSKSKAKNAQETIIYRKIRTGDEDSVFYLVRAGFDEYVRPDLTDEGISEFFRAAREMIYDKPTAHLIMVAESKNGIIGLIDIRDNNHICLFFIARDFQGRGIGRSLLDRATAECIENSSTEIEVNSSLYAVPIYKRLGFVQTKSEQLVNGIRFVPMAKSLRR